MENKYDEIKEKLLKRIIEKAKREQVPADVINRNIDKAKKGEVENFDVVEYEAFAQGGSNLIVKCLTDNPNRTISFVKTVFNKCGAKIAGQNAVSFMYEHLGAVGLKGHSEDEVMETTAIDDTIYPLAIPTGTKLVSEEKIKKAVANIKKELE